MIKLELILDNEVHPRWAEIVSFTVTDSAVVIRCLNPEATNEVRQWLLDCAPEIDHERDRVMDPCEFWISDVGYYDLKVTELTK